jgi:Na+/proline symporter
VLAGLIMAAILAAAMSNLSAALNSLASTTVMDFLRPIISTSTGEAIWLSRARWATLVWGAVLFGVALLARNWGGVLQAGLSIASILYGALLGVFLLGLLTKRVGEIAAMCGMTSSLILMLYIGLRTSIAFTWYVLIGTAATCGVGLLVSLFFKEETPLASK